jgi:6-phosphogluconolactonase
MFFYVGTYSVRGSEGIYTFRLDPQSGALTLVGSASGGLNNLSYQALHPSGRFLYSASETRKGQVAAFALDPQTGLLQFHSHQSALGDGTCHVAVDHLGKHVLAANYDSGTIVILPIGNDGHLAPAATIPKDSLPSRVNHEGRQMAAHAHSIQTDPSDRLVIAADLGCDKLFLYRYDPVRGSLAPSSPAFTATRPGAGPRHFAFHPTQPLVFVLNELNSTIMPYHYDKSRDTLEETRAVSMLPPDFKGKNTAAEIRVHPSGRFVYGSNRGHDSIAAFAIDPATGQVRLIGDYPTHGRTPRNFGIDPTGNWLIAANQDTDNLVVFRIDPATGRLAANGVTASVPGPVCVTFAKA